MFKTHTVLIASVLAGGLSAAAMERAPFPEPAKCLGRDFWPLMLHVPGVHWLGANSDFPEDVALFKDAGLAVRGDQELRRTDIPDLEKTVPPNARRLLGVNDWMTAAKYRGDWVTNVPEIVKRKTPYGVRDFFPKIFAEGSIDKTRPFLLNVTEARPPFFLRDDGYPLADRADYAAFLKEYPNFMGFRVLGEFDSEVVFYDYFLKAKTVPDEKVRQHFLKKFPLAADGSWQMRKWLRTCYSNSVDMLFGETRLTPMLSCWVGGIPMVAAELADRAGPGAILAYEPTTQSAGPWALAGAFMRGAARQNDLTVNWYMASYNAAFYKTNRWQRVCGDNYFNDRIGPASKYRRRENHYTVQARGPYVGASKSMLEREFLYGWLIGATSFTTEAWEWNYVEGTKGNYRLSEYGRAIEGLYRKMKVTDRGVSHTPVALLVSIEEPINIHLWSGKLRERFTQPAVFTTLCGCRFSDWWCSPTKQVGSQGCFFNNEFGEMYDVLAADRGRPTAETAERLRRYSYAMLVGDSFDRRAFDVRALERYVREGGTLIVSSSHIREKFVSPEFAGLRPGKADSAGSYIRDAEGESDLDGFYAVHAATPTTARPLATDDTGLTMIWENRVGEGRVLTVACDRYLPAYYANRQVTDEKTFMREFEQIVSGHGGLGLLRHIFRRLRDKTMPVKVTGDCQWGVNKTKKGLLVWVFSNKGVIKWADTPEEFDMRRRATVGIEIGARTARDAFSGEPIEVRDGRISFALNPGGWKLVEVQ